MPLKPQISGCYRVQREESYKHTPGRPPYGSVYFISHMGCVPPYPFHRFSPSITSVSTTTSTPSIPSIASVASVASITSPLSHLLSLPSMAPCYRLGLVPPYHPALARFILSFPPFSISLSGSFFSHLLSKNPSPRESFQVAPKEPPAPFSRFLPSTISFRTRGVSDRDRSRSRRLRPNDH